MPVYEYNCPRCGVFEIFFKPSASTYNDAGKPRPCPECKKTSPRIMSDFCGKVDKLSDLPKDVAQRVRKRDTRLEAMSSSERNRVLKAVDFSKKRQRKK